MANSEDLPRTVCPSPGAFERALRMARGADAEAVVCLTISSDLSTTFQSALTAAAACEGQIAVHVIDSRTVSSGLGTLVLDAAKVAAEGADIGTVLRRVSDLIPRTHVLAALNTLENLKKGGRIGGAAVMVGSLLSIKPVIDLSGGV
jgi:DegV family protein with EDD domain